MIRKILCGSATRLLYSDGDVGTDDNTVMSGRSTNFARLASHMVLSTYGFRMKLKVKRRGLHSFNNFEHLTRDYAPA